MIVNSDALTHLMMMDDESVHCCITSPPYFGLRDYKVDGQIGLEKTPEEYVRKLVEIFHEVKRVLRNDGTFWLNIGDSYSGSNSNNKAAINPNSISYNAGATQGGKEKAIGIVPGCKEKDMIGIPWLLAFALRADGWYLRADLPWIKRNSMPSSVTDRPASSIEHVFLFSKSKKYYYDHVATMQPSSESYNKDKRPRGQLTQRVGKDRKYPEGNPEYSQFRKQDNTGNNTYTGFNDRWKAKNLMEKGQTVHSMHIQRANGEGEVGSSNGLRFMRDSDFFFRTWQGLLHNEDGEPMALIVNPRGYKGAHFACFPTQLVEPMILAGTSEKGVCPVCGSPWKRVIEKESFITRPTFGNENQKQKLESGNAQGLERTGGHVAVDCKTISWQPTCTCGVNPVSLDMCGIPATILDPFAGSSATGVACKWHNRNYIGIELNSEYCKLSEQRIQEGK